MVDMSRYNLYVYGNNRVIAYDKQTQRNISFPRVLMEDYLQRKLLKNEEVHHIDGNTLNNDISNLCVMTRTEHIRFHNNELHYRNKYFDKIETCAMCKKEFTWSAKQQKLFYQNKTQTEKRGKIKHGPFCSKYCAGLYSALLQHGKL